MKYIFSGDIEYIGLEVISDPSEVVKRICFMWPKAVFHQMTGILIPDNVDSLALEPTRNIFAIKYEEEIEAEVFENAQDMPQFMQDLWINRNKIRMYLKADIQEARDDGYFYHYDEAQDKIIKTADPNREHVLASRELNSTRIGCRIITDLVDALIAKGIITEADLPDYFDNYVGKLKNIINRINWDLM